MSVVQMDDPVMILAVKEGLLEPLTVGEVRPTWPTSCRARRIWTACGPIICSPGSASPTAPDRR